MTRKVFALIAAALIATATPALADTWTIGLYLCGSDLESRAGAATSDIVEAIGADLSDEINFIVMTGGSNEWKNEAVDASKLQIWKVANSDIGLLTEMPTKNMGDPDTLQWFIEFLRDNYPADKRAFIMWDHGGGSVGGISYDERYGDDRITLPELSAVLEKSVGGSEEPWFELFGFDACLMATIDTATAVYPHAKYMVASQNLEPGNGWQYTHLLNGLSKDTSIDGEAFGRIICDAFLAGCEDVGTADGATLSVIDVGKIPYLRAAYDSLGLEAFGKANEIGNGFYSQWARSASGADNYSNSKSEGFTNMVDLGGLADNMRENMPDGASFVSDILGQTVLYKVSGGAFRRSSGISCYYPFDSSGESWLKMAELWPSAFDVLAGVKIGALKPSDDYYKEAIKYIRENCDSVMKIIQNDQQQTQSQGGFFSQIAAAASAAQNVSAPRAVTAFDITKLEDHPIEITSSGDIKIDLGPDVMENIEDVLFDLCYYSEEDDVMMMLGSDAGLEGDWDNGVFTDNFAGKWMALDGHFLMTEVTYYGSEMIRYSVPIILNGKRCALQMIYDFESETYALIGAREQRDSDSPPDKILIRLKAGDEISTLCLAKTLSGDDEMREIEMETFKLSDGFEVKDTDMGDGKFTFMYEMRDIQGNSALSAVAGIEVVNGEISVMEL